MKRSILFQRRKEKEENKEGNQERGREGEEEEKEASGDPTRESSCSVLLGKLVKPQQSLPIDKLNKKIILHIGGIYKIWIRIS